MTVIGTAGLAVVIGVLGVLMPILFTLGSGR